MKGRVIGVGYTVESGNDVRIAFGQQDVSGLHNQVVEVNVLAPAFPGVAAKAPHKIDRDALALHHAKQLYTAFSGNSQHAHAQTLAKLQCAIIDALNVAFPPNPTFMGIEVHEDATLPPGEVRIYASKDWIATKLKPKDGAS